MQICRLFGIIFGVMSSEETYRRFARYYDLYVGDFDADLPLYRSLCAPGHRNLEVGCGTGRVLQALLETGCSVAGVDISEDMLRVAEAKLRQYLVQGKLVLRKHDFRRSPLPERFDRILVTFFTFNYLLAPSEQQQFLLNVRQSLAADGALVIDFFYPQPLAFPATNDQWQESVLQAEDWQVGLRQKRRMAGDVEERIQIFTDGAQRDEIVTRRRYVSKAQAAVLLEQAGFEGLQVTDEYAAPDFRPLVPGETTESSFTILTRAR